MPRFYVLSGPEIGKSHDAGEGATFGRSPDCAVPLRGGSISRNHAQLEKHGDVWVLVDLGSRNGIAKHGARSERIELAEGDVVTLGDVELRFRTEVEASPPKPAPPRAAPPRSAPAPPAPAPTRDDIELEEIELEDDVGEVEIDFDPYAAPAPPPPRPAPPEPAPSKPAPPSSPPSSPAKGPSAKARVAERAAAAGIATRGANKGGPVEVRDAGRPVLQFNAVPDRRGFLVSDLSQYPLWVKVAAGLLVTAVFVAIFLFAFQGAAMLKGGGGGGAELVEDVDVE